MPWTSSSGTSARGAPQETTAGHAQADFGAFAATVAGDMQHFDFGVRSR
jgi:hypothetical protein